MKQFNLEEYKKNPNRRVITRDGKNTRIVCTDMIGTSYPILVVCEDERDTGPRPSVHRITPALEDCSEEGRGKRRGQLVGHDLGWD